MEGLKYVAGFLAFKFRNTYPDLGSKTCEHYVFEKKECPWIFDLSRGGLTAPSPEFVDKILQFEKIFSSLHGSGISKEAKVVQKTIEKISEAFPHFPVDIIKKYSRTRTFIRMKFLNHNLKVETEAIRARNSAKKIHFQK
jgi:hypothetical protein